MQTDSRRRWRQHPTTTLTDFTTRRHFFGAELIRMLRVASHLPPEWS